MTSRDCLKKREQRDTGNPSSRNSKKAKVFLSHTGSDMELNNFFWSNLLAQVRNIPRLAEARVVFASFEFHECLFIVRSSIHKVVPLEAEDPFEYYEIWAFIWARNLQKQDEKAILLDKCRRILKAMLCKVCELCFICPSNPTTQPLLSDRRGLVNGFGKRRILTLLNVVVVMDRANTLINHDDPTTGALGCSWYAAVHEDNGVDMPNGTGPTMNKRFMWLYHQRDLKLNELEHLTRWLSPATPADVPEPVHQQPMAGASGSQGGWCEPDMTTTKSSGGEDWCEVPMQDA